MKKIEEIVCFSCTKGLSEMLAQTEYLTNLFCSIFATEDLLNFQTLSIIKRITYFINVGRGKTLAERDLIALLDNGHLSRAFLDLFRTETLHSVHRFRNHKKILIIPHNLRKTSGGSATLQFFENYKRAISGKELLHFVDMEHRY